ncbi:MAG: DUF5011 domain-containing protein [Candidatus Micrarchaeota archaeon]|nr:DUF5011 domain-containing protein [Candidatus Micrarchaeota archaeon]
MLSSEGAYPVYATANDASGNSNITGTINVTIDATAPAISSHDNITAEATSSSGTIANYALPAATDNYDSNVAVNCMPSSGSAFALGTTQVACTAADAAGNTGTASFGVIVRDTTAPAISLLGMNPETIEVHNAYSDAGATASDIYDGDLTANISNVNPVNKDAAGTYTVTYDVNDSNGNHATQASRTVNVVSTAGNASSMNASGFSSIEASINGTAAASGSVFNETLPVNISDNGTQLLNFNYNFSMAVLDFGKITITGGTGPDGAAYLTVDGINSSAIAGTKALYIYNASSAFNCVCVKDIEGIVNVGQISSACNGASETLVPCTGADTGGYACTANGTTLAITGLMHSGVRQQYVAPPVPVATASSSSGSNGGGFAGGGSSSASTIKETAEYSVDVGAGSACQVIVTREMASAAGISTLTTTLENTGGSSCNLENFTFTDTIPSDFPALDVVTFTPQYTNRWGWTVSFNFPAFAAGESKTLTYSANQWIKTSLAKSFTAYAMAAKKKQQAAPPITPPAPTPAPAQKPVTQSVKKTRAAALEEPAIIPNATAPKTDENVHAGALFDSGEPPAMNILLSVAIISFVAFAGLAFGLWRKISGR